jgi:hypothetical protein
MRGRGGGGEDSLPTILFCFFLLSTKVICSKNCEGIKKKKKPSELTNTRHILEERHLENESNLYAFQGNFCTRPKSE